VAVQSWHDEVLGRVIPILVVRKSVKLHICMHMKIKLNIKINSNLFLDLLGGTRDGDEAVDVRNTDKS
jgi:hypothetical protein